MFQSDHQGESNIFKKPLTPNINWAIIWESPDSLPPWNPTGGYGGAGLDERSGLWSLNTTGPNC